MALLYCPYESMRNSPFNAGYYNIMKLHIKTNPWFSLKAPLFQKKTNLLLRSETRYNNI